MKENTNISAALVAAQADVGHVKKERAEGLPYDIISDAAVLTAVRKAISDAGLAIVPIAVDVLSRETFGKSTVQTVVRVTYRIVHTSGESIECASIGEAMDNSDKAIAKCLTMARKSLFRQMFLLESDDPEFERNKRPVTAGKNVFCTSPTKQYPGTAAPANGERSPVVRDIERLLGTLDDGAVLQRKMLDKRNLASIDDLKPNDARQILVKLQSQIDDKQIESALAKK